MKTKLISTLLGFLLSLSAPTISWAAGPGGGQQAGAQCNSLNLSEEEEATLLFMREEEKMARDLYLRFKNEYAPYGVLIFGNIAASEQKHMDAVKRLLDKYGLTDPVGDNVIGEFVNTELGALYKSLLTQGLTSVKEAFKVGVQLEKTDIRDLVQAIAESDERCIDKVYLNLLQGSVRHLSAFKRKLP
jgi:hypothetical protein